VRSSVDAGVQAPARRRMWCAVTACVLACVVAPGASAYAAPPQRAYELVSRGDGNFGDVLRVPAAADEGDRVLSIATGSTGAAHSSLLLSSVLSARTAGGWTSVSSDPVIPEFTAGQQRIAQTLAVSSDFSRILISLHGDLVPDDADNGGSDLYLVDVATGVPTLLTVGSPRPATFQGSLPYFIGASRDLSRVYFRMESESLLPSAPAGAIYEWHDGELDVASVRPDLTETADPPAAWVHTRSGFDPNPGASSARLAHGGPHVVSDDGSTLFFGDLANLYARRDGTTTQVNESQRTGGGSPSSVTFAGASRDGDTVYFFSVDQLTDAATPGGGLYRFTLSSGALEQLTPDAGDPTGLGVSDANMSDDASHMYFVASAALTPSAQAGVPHVYVYDAGETRLVATIPAGATVQRVSRNGRFAVIQTTGSLGGAATNGHVTLYEYDDQAAQIACVSCRSDGAPSEGDASLDDTAPPGISSFPTLSSPRNVTDNGEVFFASQDELVPGDVTSSWDVYEFAGGGLSLLSSGRSQYDSYVADNSDDGTDAFLVTHSALLPEDADSGLADIYDARVGGGFAQPVTDEIASCASDCRHPLPPPVLALPGSSNLQDAGNLDEVPAASGRPATVAVSSAKTVSGTAVTLRIKVSGPGTIRISGPSMAKGAKSAARATTYSVRALLTAKGKAAVRRRGALKVTMTVVFQAKDGSSVSKKLTVTFKRPKGSR
jgi:hypothetical protein